MPKYLDGLVPMVLALAIWSWILDRPITMTVILAMAAATIMYQSVKFFIRNNNSEENSHG